MRINKTDETTVKLCTIRTTRTGLKNPTLDILMILVATNTANYNILQDLIRTKIDSDYCRLPCDSINCISYALHIGLNISLYLCFVISCLKGSSKNVQV